MNDAMGQIANVCWAAALVFAVARWHASRHDREMVKAFLSPPDRGRFYVGRLTADAGAGFYRWEPCSFGGGQLASGAGYAMDVDHRPGRSIALGKAVILHLTGRSHDDEPVFSFRIDDDPKKWERA